MRELTMFGAMFVYVMLRALQQRNEAPGRRDPAESVAHARELRHNLSALMVLKAVSCNGDHNPGEDVPLPVCGNEGREMRSGRNQASAVVRQGRDRVERHHEHGEHGYWSVRC
jgi:hypothetical protein